jgi:malate synthase
VAQAAPGHCRPGVGAAAGTAGTPAADRQAGQDPRFLRETESVRNDPNWRVAPPAPGLEDRRVEITGPVDKKMTINALNSGAKVWLADMEDSSTPSWRNVIQGQLNLTDAWSAGSTSPRPRARNTSSRPGRGTAHHRGPAPRLAPARKAHAHQRQPIAGGIVDFGLYFFHNARRLIAQGKGPYFYLPKIENHLEARLWNDIFILAQDLLGIPQGTIRATVLIETITAAFEMEEILYELRDHAAGLNAGRWDYIFSLIKNFRTRGPRFVLPDRGQVTMTPRSCGPTPNSWSGPATSAAPWRSAAWPPPFPTARTRPPTPSPSRRSARTRPARQPTASTAPGWRTRTWCRSAARCSTASSAISPTSWSACVKTSPRTTGPSSTSPRPPGTITEQGIRNNIEVGIRYIESWLRGNGAVAIHNLMEDAATAEISRSQLWQWIYSRAITDHGDVVTREWVEELLDEEFARLERFDGDRFDDARDIFEEVTLSQNFPAFLTLPAYARR